MVKTVSWPRWKAISYIVLVLLFALSQTAYTSSLEVAISSSADDAEEDLTNNAVSLTDDLEFVDPPDAGPQYIGMRFTTITIPQYAQIDAAYIQFQSDETTASTGGSKTYIIYGQATGNASTFTTTTADISSRAKTGTSALWTSPTWATNTEGTDQKTADFASVIQEIVNRPDWVSGNSIVIMIRDRDSQDADYQRAESYDTESANAPYIHIDYSTREDYSTWQFSKTWFINTTSTGANVSTNQTYFPIPVNLTSSNFTFSQAMGSGQDLRFAKSDGTPLFYEIEKWDSTNALATIWVRLDTIYGNNNAKSFKMYWGKPGETSQSNGAKVFSTLWGFRGVWHMADATDATANANNGTKQSGTEPTTQTTSCTVGNCQDFAAAGDYIDVPWSMSLDVGTTFSMLFWHKEEGTVGGFDRIMSRKTGWNDAAGWEICMSNGDNDAIEFLDADGGGGNGIQNIVANWGAAAWEHIGTVWNGTSTTAYGYKNSGATGSLTHGGGSDVANGITFGDDVDHTEAKLDGDMDEVWYLDTVVSADYIKLAYESQKATSTLLTSSTITWNGQGADNKWSTGGNWTGGSVPGSSDIVVFDGTSAKPCSLTTSTTITSLIVENAYTGTLSFTDKTLSLTGNANFGTGIVIAAGTGAIAFTGSSAQILIPPASQTLPGITQNGSGGTTIANNALTAGQLTITTGNFDLGDIAKVHTFSAFSAGGGSIDFGTSTLSTSGNVNLNSLSSITTGTGTLKLTSSSGTQVLTPLVLSSHPNILHSGAGTMQLATNPLSCLSFTNSAGTIDFNSLNISTTNDFIVSSGGTSTITNLSGRTITVSGSATFSGANGSSLLNLDPNSGWNITVTGTLRCTYCTLKNSNATSSAGLASGSTNSGSNTNWTFDSEDYSTWTYSRNLYMNTTASGANITTNQYNFPLLLRFTSSNFTFSQALSLGKDVRFAKANGEHIPYQINRWDSTGATGTAWIRMDTVYANFDTKYIVMYWGKAGETDNSDGTLVFPTSANFDAVYHMDTTLDATANANNGTKKTLNTEPAAATGCVVGDCQDFDGTDDYMDVPNSASLDFGGTFTIMGWFKWESGGTPTAGARIISRKGAWNDATGWELTNQNPADNDAVEICRNNGCDGISGVVSSWSAGTWYHLALKFNGTSFRAYTNGDSAATSTITLGQTVSDNDLGITFGDQTDHDENQFNGKLDEIWLYDALPTNQFIKLAYKNQMTGSTTINYTVPVITGLSATDTASAVQTSSTVVTIGYEVDDPDNSTVTISAKYKVSGGSTWTTLTNTSGDIGAGVNADNPTTDRSITWTAASQMTVEGDYQVLVIASDGTNLDTTVSDTFYLDTQAPVGLASLAATPSSNYIDVTWTAPSEANFNHYEIWYGTSQSDVQNRNGAAIEWDNADDVNLATRATASTRITGLTSGTTYYLKIWAYDNAGNTTTISDINTTTISTVGPVWSKASLGTLNGGAIGTTALYIGSDNDALYSISLANGGTNWIYSTASYGDCNTPSYAYSTNYKIYATAGNYLIGRQDDGTSSSQLWTPVNLAATAGNPYAAPDNDFVYVTYTNKIGKYNASTGVTVGGNYPVTLTGVSTLVDPVIYADQFFVSTQAGVVWKYDDDGTPLSSYTLGDSLLFPLVMQLTTLYATPKTNSLVAITASTMAAKWSPTRTLQTTNSGPAFIANEGNKIYVAAGNYVQKISDDGGSASIAWTYNASDSVKSGPLMPDNYVYFGRKSNNAYAIKDADGTLQANWPYTSFSGSVYIGPWIDITNGRVLFGTEAGTIESFTKE